MKDPNNTTARTAAENFQNETLRPILKRLHQSLTFVFEHYARKRKAAPEQLSKDRRRDKFKELITRDNRLRGLLFGMAIGHFSEEEVAYYVLNEGEMNRRMTGLLVERILSNY